MRRGIRPLARRLPSFAALTAGAILWEVGGRALDFSFFPPMSSVVHRLVELIAEGEVLPSLALSLSNLAVGFGISLVAGTAIGILMGLSWKIEAALDVYVYALLTTPTLIFAPIFFTIFGLGRETIIAIIILNSILFIIINTTTTIRESPPALIEMAHSFGARRWQLFRKVVLPAALPLIMAGFVLAAPRAVKGMVNGEMFIAAVGLGFIVIRAGSRFDATTVLAITLLIVVIAFVFIELIRVIDRRVNRWLPSTARAT